MALEIKLSQKLSQTLVMTPQLQQAIKLLQLGRVDYMEVLERELLENPILEDSRQDADEPIEGETRSADGAAEGLSDASLIDTVLSGGDQSETELLDTVLRTGMPQGDESAEGTPEYFYDGVSRSRSADGGERPSIEAFASAPEGLSSHLLWQLRTSDVAAEDLAIAAQIVGNLDKNGYLASSLEELSDGTGFPVESLERVLELVQELDPPGIAARDLRECLLIQLEQLGLGGSLSWRIVSHHLSDLELQRYDQVAKKENVGLDEVIRAVRGIQRLEPRPGRPFVDEAPVYITPDVYVRKVGDEYIVSLNDAGMPKLRLNPMYRDMVARGAISQASGALGADRDYLMERIRSASWLIKSVYQRQQTILRVTESIMRFQREFLEQGVSALRPLVLREVADDVGMHESTVSRVTTNKYVHTPQGIYELKFFFSSALRSSSGDVSSESVREKIRDLIAKENQKKPLSDQALVNKLRADGIDIARRTVAKYRESMNILSSARRKKPF